MGISLAQEFLPLVDVQQTSVFRFLTAEIQGTQ